MVELLKDFPDHVVAYEASGKVTSDEYENIVMKRVDEVAETYGRINFLVCLQTEMENYSISALMDYIKISFKHFSKWERMAIVTDEDWVRKAYELLGPVVHGTIKSYTLEEYNQAKQWVSQPLGS